MKNTSAQARRAGVDGSQHGQPPAKQPRSREASRSCQC